MIEQDFMNRVIELHSKNLSQVKITKILNSTLGKVRYALFKNGSAEYNTKRTCESFKRSDKYIKIRKPDHHRADNQGYVLEHVLIMEKELGRPINKNEKIHHIDGDHSNNNINNLVILTPSEHTFAHRSLEKIGLDLVKKGKIYYDKNQKIYKLKWSEE